MNTLYPIFLKAHQLNILIVGGGNVALEKLTFLLKSSPQARVTVIALDFIPEVETLLRKSQLQHRKKAYESSDLMNSNIVIGATNNEEVNRHIYYDCKARNILVNIADNPAYCDFYMGGIVTKGNLKIAISTNGKSPTVAKRLREYFEAFLPENMNVFLDNIHTYRSTLKNDFQYKIETLNKLTESILQKPN